MRRLLPGKPVLMLDSSRRVAGTGEYDPFGNINRFTVHQGTAHPYAHNLSNAVVADFTHASGGPSLSLDMRVWMPVVEQEVSAQGTCDDWAKVRDGICWRT